MTIERRTSRLLRSLAPPCAALCLAAWGPAGAAPAPERVVRGVAAAAAETTTITPTATPTPTATHTITPGGPPQELTVSGLGLKGVELKTRAPAELTLLGPAQGAVNAGADIGYPAAEVSLDFADCVVDAGLLDSHELRGGNIAPGALRVEVVLRSDPQGEIFLPTGVLATCPFDIPPDLPLGFVAMEVRRPLLTDASGQALPVVAVPGGVEIGPLPRNSLGCSVDGRPPGQARGGRAVAAIAALLCALRAASRRREGACRERLRRALALVLTAASLVGPAVAGAQDTALTGPTPPASDQQHAARSGRSPAEYGEIEEILVSARKRPEPLQDTPISVAVLSPQVLRDAGVSRLDQIQGLVPNLTFVTPQNGVEFNAIIRGVGQLEEAEPGVGIYVDGVYLPRTANSLLNVVDVAQIEVLRGPQGTLFGKNTVGGAISITTVKPHDEFDATAFVRAGNFDRVETHATLNLPVWAFGLEDNLFTRFSFASANGGGYTQNLQSGKYYNNQDALWFLGSLRFVPSDDVEINVSGNWFEDRSRGRGGRCTFVQDPPDPTVGLLLCVPCQGALFPPGWETPVRLLSLRPEALGAVQEVTNGLKHSEKKPL